MLVYQIKFPKTHWSLWSFCMTKVEKFMETNSWKQILLTRHTLSCMFHSARHCINRTTTDWLAASSSSCYHLTERWNPDIFSCFHQAQPHVSKTSPLSRKTKRDYATGGWSAVFLFVLVLLQRWKLKPTEPQPTEREKKKKKTSVAKQSERVREERQKQ